jgi:hypothetical protein
MPIHIHPKVDDSLNYLFNPLDNRHNALEKIKEFGWFKRAGIVSATVFVSILTLGLGTIGTFRFLTKTFSVKKGNTPPDPEIQEIWSKTPKPPSNEPTPLLTSVKIQQSPLPPKPAGPAPRPPVTPEPQKEKLLPTNVIDEAQLTKDTEAKKALLIDFFKEFAPFNIKTDSFQVSRFEQAASLEDLKKITTKRNLAETEEYLSSFPDKPFSNETKRHLAFLIGYLAIHPELGLELGRADENGDCFYHSIAQQLSVAQNKPITTRMIHEAISNYVNNIKPSREKEILEKAIKENHNISYEEYKKIIPLTIEDGDKIKKEKDALEKEITSVSNELRQNLSKEQREILLSKRMDLIAKSNALQIPTQLWGCWEIEAKIASKVYNCEIKALSLDSLKSTKDDKRLEPFIKLLDNDTAPILYIAQYGSELRSHFVPLVPKK